MTINWKFPPNGGGLAAGANDGAIDTFKGHRLSSVVREVAQNSLDAVENHNRPVSLEFSLFQLSPELCPEILGLRSALVQCEQIATEQKLDKDIKFYKKAVTLMERSEQIPFLAIHDSNTAGLKGPPDGPTGAWHALVKGSGLTQKHNTHTLGSYGHGSKAPFTLTDIRSVFYLSTIETERGIQHRFQGKSILQSHRDPQTSRLTQGTGFFGHEDDCKLLIDEEIPRWALETRAPLNGKTGTSLLIPFYSLGVSEEIETAITLVANFYFAIKTGKLEVRVGERVINQATLDAQAEELEKLLESGEQDYIDVDHTRNCFKAISAIVHAEEKGEQQIKDLGQVRWFLRFGEDLDRGTVSIARQNGMLITRAAPNLQKFPHKKPFEMFVCVTGNGSDLLKRLENPAHDQLEFERIDDKSERKKCEKEYKKIQKKIREVINNYASLDQHDDILVDDLRDLFSDITEGSSGDSLERSRRIQISRGLKKITTPKIKGGFSDEMGGIQDVPGRGKGGGLGPRKTSGGRIPDPQGTGKTKAPTDPSGSSHERYYALTNLRVLINNISKQKLTLYFDSPGSGDFDLKLFKKGEFGEESVQLIEPQNQTLSESIGLEISTTSDRASVELVTVEDCADFALTAKVLSHE